MTLFAVHNFILALTPVQRLRSAGQFSTSANFEMWFLGLAGFFLVALAVVFMWSRYRAYALAKINPREKQLFFNLGQKAGLSSKEVAYLFRMAELLCLTDPEDIFNMPEGFTQMAAYLWEECLHKQGAEAAEALEVELVCLKQKLQFNTSEGSACGHFSSRQIPVGEEITIVRQLRGRPYELSATVIDNTETGLQVVMTTETEVSFGEVWQIEVAVGGGTWAFESTPVSYDGTSLMLAQSENLKFMRRRSFIRAAVNRKAYLAPFPFSCTVNGEESEIPFSSVSEATTPEATENIVLYPAVLKEMAGPELVFDSQMPFEIGNRVLVIFNLDDNGKDSTFRRQMSMKSYEKIIRDVGTVKKNQSNGERFWIHIDLVKLTNHEMNELVYATYATSKSNEPEPVTANAEVQQSQQLVQAEDD